MPRRHVVMRQLRQCRVFHTLPQFFHRFSTGAVDNRPRAGAGQVENAGMKCRASEAFRARHGSNCLRGAWRDPEAKSARNRGSLAAVIHDAPDAVIRHPRDGEAGPVQADLSAVAAQFSTATMHPPGPPEKPTKAVFILNPLNTSTPEGQRRRWPDDWRPLPRRE